jgi:hypothetical protein
MFRVRLPNGREAAYRSVAELSHAIGRGEVTTDAEFFHSATATWQRIGSRPEYAEAFALLASGRRRSDAVEVPPPATLPVTSPGRRDAVVPVYQMSSYSARELEARRPARWVFPAVTAALALVLLVALLWDTHPVPGRAEEVVAVGLFPGRAAALNAPPEAIPTSPTLQFTPEALAQRCLGARARAVSVLDSSSRQAGLAGLNSAGRLTDTDSARATLTALAKFALLVRDYRANQQEREVAYRDTARSLVAARRWTSIDLTEWRARTTRRDPHGLRQNQADSLLAALEDLFTVLRNASRGYRYQDGALQFARHEAADDYNEARARVERLRLASDRELDSPAPPALLVLSNSIGGALPPGH